MSAQTGCLILCSVKPFMILHMQSTGRPSNMCSLHDYDFALLALPLAVLSSTVGSIIDGCSPVGCWSHCLLQCHSCPVFDIIDPCTPSTQSRACLLFCFQGAIPLMISLSYIHVRIPIHAYLVMASKCNNRPHPFLLFLLKLSSTHKTPCDACRQSRQSSTPTFRRSLHDSESTWRDQSRRSRRSWRKTRTFTELTMSVSCR